MTDALGRVIYTTTDQGNTLQYAYTMTGQIFWEQSDDQLTQYDYDELGRVVEVTEYDQNELDALGLCLVVFDLNGASLNASPIQQVRRGATITLPALSRTGYTFNGWYNGNTLVNKGGAFRVTENCTLTAKWTVNSYAIAYDLNGGFLSGAQELTAQVCDYGTTVRLTSVIPCRTGYTFVGWGLSADANIVYPSGAAVTSLTPRANAVITFYAIWSLDPADVPVPSVPTFPGDGAASSASTVSTYAARSTTTGVTKTYAYDKANWVTKVTSAANGTTLEHYAYSYYARWECTPLQTGVGTLRDSMHFVAQYTYFRNQTFCHDSVKLVHDSEHRDSANF